MHNDDVIEEVFKKGGRLSFSLANGSYAHVDGKTVELSPPMPELVEKGLPNVIHLPYDDSTDNI